MQPILMVDDDADDCMLAEKALRKNRVTNPVVFLGDGEALLAYLRREGAYAEPAPSPRPCIVLLDLNMPKMNGREALKAIRADPGIRNTPVVVLTTSHSEEDITRCRELGADSFLSKPVDFKGFVALIGSLKKYWQQA
jgi:CheY-like chemotaxis protein